MACLMLCAIIIVVAQPPDFTLDHLKEQLSIPLSRTSGVVAHECRPS